MSAGGPSSASRPPAGRSPQHPRGTRRARRFSGALGWTVLGALVPGTALLRAGRRVLGAVVLIAFLALVAGGVWLATAGRRTGAHWAVDRTSLLWLTVAAGVVALLWAAVVVAGYAMLVPRRTSRARHALGGAVVLVLVAAVAAPAVLVGQLAGTTRDLIAGVFTDGDSATVDDPQEPDPFGDQERVNVLLLGGDGGPGREGVRTDTVIVASIDTDTGRTTLISLPRNLENLPFPEGSQLAEIYPAPRGFWTGDENESLLNAVYRNGPALHPDALGRPSDNPGADWLKLGVGEALGLDIDYYVLVNLDGFERLVDVLGGIRVNVNNWVPIGGDPGTGQLPSDYIEPGPDQLLDGGLALNFARGRFGLSDYDRMARQRCAIDAIIDRADPVTLLRRYEQLAATTRDIVLTDIPSNALDDFVDLAFLVKDAPVESLVFDDTVIDPAFADYDLIRRLVDEALDPRPADDGSNGSNGSASPSSAAPSSAAPVDDGTTTPSTAPADGSAEPTPGAVDVDDACAYDEQAAREALAQGEPPTS
jgi:polyisoprenyl-teichoic acid--peptidoglycan teichoic acid transferase